MNVNRSTVIQQLVDKHHYTKKAATELIEDFMDIIIDNMRQGNSVTLQGFGCFDIIERKAHPCMNPATGEPMVIPAHWVPKFYPGSKMKMAVKLLSGDEAKGVE